MNLHSSRIIFKIPVVNAKVRPPSRQVSEIWVKYKDVPVKILKPDVRKTQVNKN